MRVPRRRAPAAAAAVRAGCHRRRVQQASRVEKGGGPSADVRVHPVLGAQQAQWVAGLQYHRTAGGLASTYHASRSRSKSLAGNCPEERAAGRGARANAAQRSAAQRACMSRSNRDCASAAAAAARDTTVAGSCCGSPTSTRRPPGASSCSAIRVLGSSACQGWTGVQAGDGQRVGTRRQPGAIAACRCQRRALPRICRQPAEPPADQGAKLWPFILFTQSGRCTALHRFCAQQ